MHWYRDIGLFAFSGPAISWGFIVIHVQLRSCKKRLEKVYLLLNLLRSEVRWSRSVMSDSLRPPWTVAYQALLSMGFFQARVLEWVAISFSRGSSQPRDQTQVSLIVGRRFTFWATRDVYSDLKNHINYSHVRSVGTNYVPRPSCK